MATVLLLLLAPGPARAQRATDPEPEKQPPGEESVHPAIVEERVMVLGNADKARETAGSADYLDRDALERHEHSDVQRVLRRVAGVYLQDEEGYGLRPNIGMRGTGVERSQKITLMEDGTLIAPAPYAAPSAYYFPTTGRMSAIEVSKGPASIKQGPQTNGGVLNLISTPIPLDLGGRAELALGDDEMSRAHIEVGDSRERIGWLLETFQEQTAGFKRLDDGGETGYDLADYVGKLRVSSREGASTYQSLELKLGRTDQEGRETYLGLATDDFAATPFRRYAASSRDGIRTEHEQIQLRHFVVPTPRIDLTTTVYRNTFFRNWRKLEKLDGNSIASVLANPDAEALAILRGDADSAPDALALRNNRRDYDATGLQSVLGLRLRSGPARHTLEIGVRLHRDDEDRFQEEDGYQMLGGAMVQTSDGAPGSQANRIQEAEALAIFVQDTLALGSWTLTPGVRFESIDYARRDFGISDPDRTGANLNVRRNEVSEIIPGLGIDRRLGQRWAVFGGVHRGFSPPGPGSDAATRPEESVNHELGARFDGAWFGLRLIGFYNDYDNLLGSDTVSSGGTGSGDVFNGGAARVRGLELSFDGDLARGRLGQAAIPVRVAYTASAGEFRSSFTTAFEDWAPEVRVGDALPYLPAHQLFVEVGWKDPAWALFLSASYVDEMRTHAGSGALDPAQRIEDHVVFDLSASRTFLEHYRAFVQVRNVTDEVYVAASRPAGLRPGLPRTVLGGFGMRF